MTLVEKQSHIWWSWTNSTWI